MSSYGLSYAILGDGNKFALARIDHCDAPWKALRQFPEGSVVMEALYFSSIKAADHHERYKAAVKGLNAGRMKASELFNHFRTLADEVVSWE